MREDRVDAEVLVIGAGLSGLYAADKLERAGLACQVIEGSSQVGGRIRTIRVNGESIDIGGTGLGPSHYRAHALVDRFGLKRLPMCLRGQFAVAVNSSLLALEEWPEHPANLTVGEERTVLPTRIDSFYMQKFLPFDNADGWRDPAYAEYDISFAQHLRNHGLSQEALRLVNMCINTNDIETVSALTIFRDALKWRSVGYNDPKNFDQYRDQLYQPVKLDGGMITLPLAMASALNRPVLLNRTVRRIEQNGDTVAVHCKDGSTLTAYRVLVTIPLMAMGEVAFDPPLPRLTGEAVAEAGRSGNTQFILQAKSRFWEKDGLPPSLWSDSVFERMFVDFNADESIHHIRIWVNGDNADRVDALGGAAGDALLATLAKLRPSTAGQLEVLHQVSWGGEKLIQGEKYVMGPGQVARFASHFSKPHGCLHWAGEHFKDKEVGIEAALASGERAAKEIEAAMSARLMRARAP